MDVFKSSSELRTMGLPDFVICATCGIVDRDQERMRVGYKCPRCGTPGEGARDYFPINISAMVGVVQELYYTKQVVPPGSEAAAKQKQRSHQLAVVIFFCALVEALLQHFLEQCMSKKALPRQVQDRLLEDSPFVKQRVEKLFPILTGVKWKKAVEILNDHADFDYIELTKFYESVSTARNNLVHKGNKWAIPQDMPEQCIRHIWPVVSLFVELHNEYIAQSMCKGQEKSDTNADSL